MKEHASGFKTKIKKVAARVDCWNRSVSIAKAVPKVEDDLPFTPKIIEPLRQKSSQKDIRTATRLAKETALAAAKEAQEIIRAQAFNS